MNMSSDTENTARMELTQMAQHLRACCDCRLHKFYQRKMNRRHIFDILERNMKTGPRFHVFHFISQNLFETMIVDQKFEIWKTMSNL